MASTEFPSDLAAGAVPAPGYREDLNVILICPNCKVFPPNLREYWSEGDIVCTDCGEVLKDKLVDTRSEWRTFANDDQGNDDPSRVGDGANHLLNGSQLETAIASGDRGARDLQRAQTKAGSDKATRSLLQAYKEIGAFCDAINIGKNVADTAKHIYKVVDDAKVLKNKPQEAVIAGCIFIACRQCKVPRTFREIYDLTNVTKKEIGRIFKQLESFLQKLKESGAPAGAINSVEGYEATVSTPAEELCGRYCSRLGFNQPQKIENVSKSLAVRSQKMSVKGISGRSPLSCAAACIYMACHLMGDPKAPREISSVCGVSEGTIKSSYLILYNLRDELIDKKWLNEGGDMSRLPSK